MQNQLHVVIDAQINLSGNPGGVEQFIAGLVHALGELEGPERYTIVGPCEKPDWLAAVLGPNQRIVSAPQPTERLSTLKRILGPLREPISAAILRTRRATSTHGKVWPVPESLGFFESLGGEVVHFPHQSFIRSALPTIYNPHDLQHRHLPDFFAPGEVARRETLYRAGCTYSRAVATASHWVAQDVERSYGVPSERIFVVHSGAATQRYAPSTQGTLDGVRRRLRLPDVFALYPAQTWPHKNHIGLIRALGLLREADDRRLCVVCTGAKNAFFPKVAREARARGVEEQVLFVGYVSPGDLRALYRLASFMVFPSLFEGGGLPVIEALRESLPVACSEATSLPEIVGDAALLFDPGSPEAIADALRRMMTDAALLAELRLRGHTRAAGFSWSRMAQTFRAVYRSVAGRSLSADDRDLLAAARSLGAVPGHGFVAGAT
jgi:glycosyltransferase involved in cell wall biosynthesis